MVAGRPAVRYQVIITALVLLMISSLLASLAGFWRLGTPQNQMLVISLVAATYGWLSWRSPWVALGLLVLGGGAAAVALNFGYLPSWVAWLQNLGSDMADFGQSFRESQLEASFGPALGALFLTFIAVGAGLLIVPEALTRGSTFWSIAFGTLVFGTEWAWYYDPSAMHFTGFAVLAFLVWTLGQAALRDARWESTGRKVGYRSHVATPVATVLVVGLLATILPTSFEPLDLGAWGEKAQEAFPVLKQLRGAGVGIGGGRFSLRSTGFAPTLGTLGGPVTLDHTVALHVTAAKPLQETLYLRGATFRDYDGRSWTSGRPEEIEVKAEGTLPSYFGSDVLRDYVTFKVKPAVSMGFTIFNAWEPMQVTGLKSAYRGDEDGNLWATKTIAKNSTYDIAARWPRYSAEQIRAIPAVPPGDAFAPYLTLPDSVTERVRDRAQELTAGIEHPYDKAVALERYLRSLPYELDVPATPQGADFVDYFLFDLQRGYCVYSASALTVMLREVGIATRVVEGFALPVSAQYTEDAGGNRTYAVLNSMAHAWVEAFFPGYGWVTFDPTPRGDLPVIDRSTPAPEASTSSSTDPGDVDPRNPTPAEDNPEDFNEGVSGGGTGGVAQTMSREWPWALAALAPLVLLFLWALRRLKLQDRIAASEGRAVVQEVWVKTGSLLTQFEAGPQAHETPREYATSLGSKWAPLKEPALQVAEEYTEARYSPPERTVAGSVSDHARTLWDKVHESLFNRFGWRKYLWRRLKWTQK